jgi:hypothetical protein
MEAQRGSRGINLFRARRGWVFNATPWPLYARERGPVPIVQEAGWASAPFGIGAENIASTGGRAPPPTTIQLVTSGYTAYPIPAHRENRVMSLTSDRHVLCQWQSVQCACISCLLLLQTVLRIFYFRAYGWTICNAAWCRPMCSTADVTEHTLSWIWQ